MDHHLMLYAIALFFRKHNSMHHFFSITQGIQDNTMLYTNQSLCEHFNQYKNIVFLTTPRHFSLAIICIAWNILFHQCVQSINAYYAYINYSACIHKACSQLIHAYSISPSIVHCTHMLVQVKQTMYLFDKWNQTSLNYWCYWCW